MILLVFLLGFALATALFYNPEPKQQHVYKAVSMRDLGCELPSPPKSPASAPLAKRR